MNYEAFVIVGGTGMLAYRGDGSFDSVGEGDRLLTATEVENVADKLESLGKTFLSQGKPVLAQCHGASIPSFWRKSETGGPDGLGESILKGQRVAGYPDETTRNELLFMETDFRENDRVSISMPLSINGSIPHPRSIVITTRDWFPQTVSHAARTLLNVLDTYPESSEYPEEKRILILHGGEIDSTDCSPSNRRNDIPCNYGTGEDLPADYRDIVELLTTDLATDSLKFDFYEIDISDPEKHVYTLGSKFLNEWLPTFHAVVFFKHWSPGVTDVIQNALINYVDNGGGIVAIHHGLYNDIDNSPFYDFNGEGTADKNILVQELFLAESAMNAWSASLTDYTLYPTSIGDFISTHHVVYNESTSAPSSWTQVPLLNGTNKSHSTYPSFSIYDELYLNMSFTESAQFSRAENEIQPLFSSNVETGQITHTSGFKRFYNGNEDDKVGRVVYLQVGERRENYEPGSTYAQILRNAMYWAGNNPNFVTSVDEEFPTQFELVSIYPNPFNPSTTISFSLNAPSRVSIDVFSLDGRHISNVFSGVKSSGSHSMIFDASKLSSGLYLVKVNAGNRTYTKKITLVR